MSRKKILIVTRNLPPLIGGMERLNWHIADELSHEHEILLLSHTKAKEQVPSKCVFFGVKLNPLPVFLLLAFFKTLFICIRHKPDILFAGSGLMAPITVFWAKIFRKKNLVYIHGLDINNSSKVYQFLWLPFIRQASRIIVNSIPTKNLAIKNKVEDSKIEIIHPGVSCPPPLNDPNLINNLKDKFDLHNKKVLLSVGRLTERKGILEFVEYCLPSIVNAEPNTRLVIIGNTAANALNNKFQTQNQIVQIAKQYHVEENIVFTGAIKDQELSQFYYLADVHVFPIKHIPEDPEGFGMVAIEAAAHGTPTIAFATGGVVDAIAHGLSGFHIQNKQYGEFSEKVINILKCPLPAAESRAFAKEFSWNNIEKKLSYVINKVSQNQNEIPRKAHAVLDLSSRKSKALKIEQLLNLRNLNIDRPIKILEIGCGSGGISHYFATHPNLQCIVTAVDVYDNRLIKEGYTFIQVKDTSLPFINNSFDIVITNHVIEHVGESQAQLHHLQEIKRILRPKGICYLAAPNRWMLTEPHYKLKFLSWLPRKYRTYYLRLQRRGDFYDCEPPSLRDLENLIKHEDFKFKNVSVPATYIFLETEMPNSFMYKIINVIPQFILNLLKPIIPTLIYILEVQK